MTSLAGHAARSWPTWFAGDTAPAIDPVILAGGPAHRRRAVVFLIPRGHHRPAVVLKIAFAHKEAAFVRQEFRALSKVRQDAPSSLLASMPEPLSFDRLGDAFVFASRAVEGRRLIVPAIAGRGSYAACRLVRGFLSGAFAWSQALAEATVREESADEGELVETAERFEALHPEARIRSFARAVGRSRIRWAPSWQHRDVSVGNVLLQLNDLRFLDWEHASALSEPWFDVAYAPGAQSLLALRQNGFSSMRSAALAALAEEGWAGALLRREMQRAWTYPLPLSWAVVLVGMRAALRANRYERMGSRDWEQLAMCLMVDDEFRSAVDWLAPKW